MGWSQPPVRLQCTHLMLRIAALVARDVVVAALAGDAVLARILIHAAVITCMRTGDSRACQPLAQSAQAVGGRQAPLSRGWLIQDVHAGQEPHLHCSCRRLRSR